MAQPLPLPILLTNSSGGATNAVLGHTEPRLWTPPLRDLTPDTSYGFDVIDFARDVLDMPLDPWEEWVVIHMGELLPDGRPRFRVVLILVARQNGKTLLSRVLTLYWMFVEEVPLILSTSNKLSYAKESLAAVYDIAKANQYLSAAMPKDAFYKKTGEECLSAINGSRYRIAAATRNAGRSLTVHRLILDELREQSTWDCWNASTKAMNAVPYGQVVAITNQGDDTSVVLDSLRNSGVAYIETGNGDPRLGLFEYSSPPGSEPDDLEALAYANPNLGRRMRPDDLLGDAKRAKRAGGQELAGFQTEVMCQRVRFLDPAIDPDLWKARGTENPLNLADYRDKVALCLDVSMDGSHATLAAAAVIDDVVRVEVVKAWDGFGCSKWVRSELPDIVARVRPRAIGWFPNGPAAVLAADMKERRAQGWPPRRVTLQDIRSETSAVCMGFAELVKVGEVEHPDDEMLNAHVEGAQKLRQGDTWVFTRRAGSPVDGLYAVAGATHLARTLPAPLPTLVAL